MTGLASDGAVDGATKGRDADQPSASPSSPARASLLGAHDAFHDRLLRLPIFARELAAGGIAGMIGKTSVAPLERVKILFQTGRMQGNGVGETLLQLLRTEGLLGLYKGNGASVLRIIPYSALHFHAYEIYRRALLQLPIMQRVLSSSSGQGAIDFAAGSAAGASAVIVTYPLDLIRTRLACMSEVHRDRPASSTRWSWSTRLTIRGVMGDVVQQEGIIGLYRGIGPTLLGILPYAGIKFYVYQSLKRHYRNARPQEGRLPIHVMLTFGGIAGLVGQTATYPLDVVRRRMQVPQYSTGFLSSSPSNALDGSLRSKAVYSSTWDGLVTISRRNGLRGLFAGLSINYMKVVPSTAVGFTMYDHLKSYLALKGNL
ncbi:unnamed protein product [Ostreobium quekettii]|uniref:Mitochondrial carrier protein n=1 Tax=Ostreobium quekettii TaxID=121088 RepID=A0A8S1J8B9_9CHLO|nr:unnamed protein product [Ostreobium quekettii]|eukprot:evm.model.scf_263.10 EVM.evm.TU.scf_263.10   scf_263:83706-87399(+)